jgi:hypothetical protein
MTIDELRRTSVLLRTLADAEVARIEGDDARVVSLLDSVDPVDAVSLARRADFDAGVKALTRRIAVVDEVLSIRTPW